jgi:hypothetical protein
MHGGKDGIPILLLFGFRQFLERPNTGVDPATVVALGTMPPARHDSVGHPASVLGRRERLDYLGRTRDGQCSPLDRHMIRL